MKRNINGCQMTAYRARITSAVIVEYAGEIKSVRVFADDSQEYVYRFVPGGIAGYGGLRELLDIMDIMTDTELLRFWNRL